MSRFLQLHMLTSYPPSNLNRDDLGRPKTAKMGGTDRLRISSQSLKRAWRKSDVFHSALNEPLGERTKLFGGRIYLHLLETGLKHSKALEAATKIAGVFGKNEKPEDLSKIRDEDRKESRRRELFAKWEARGKQWRVSERTLISVSEYTVEMLNELEAVEISQLAFISSEEQAKALEIADTFAQKGEFNGSLDLLRNTTSNVDIAMFGRMLADHPGSNIEAACQVAHAISVHSIVIEDDYFTAVDDLNDHSVDAGAAHIGETGFAAALFYTYVCVNKELLVENLGGDSNRNLANKAIGALMQAAVRVSPEGKQNSFGSRAYALYVMAEKGDQQPRSLAVAFLKPVGKQAEDYAQEAINALETQAKYFDDVYGPCSEKQYCINAHTGHGTMKELLSFVSQ